MVRIRSLSSLVRLWIFLLLVCINWEDFLSWNFQCIYEKHTSFKSYQMRHFHYTILLWLAYIQVDSIRCFHFCLSRKPVIDIFLDRVAHCKPCSKGAILFSYLSISFLLPFSSIVCMVALGDLSFSYMKLRFIFHLVVPQMKIFGSPLQQGWCYSSYELAVHWWWSQHRSRFWR